MGGISFTPSISQSTASTSYQPWVTQGGQSIFGAAQQAVGANPAQTYSGPAQAAFGPGFGQAQEYLSSQLGQTNPWTEQAGSTLAGYMPSLQPGDVNSYMNPYLDAALKPTIAKILEAADAQRSQIGAGAAMAGAYGGTGHGVQRALLDRNTQRNVGDATSQAYSAAWDKAQAQRNAALQSFLSSILGLGQLGQNKFTQGSTLAQLLASLGATEQAAGQKGISTQLDINKQNALLPAQQQGLLAALLASLPKDSTTQTTGISFGGQQQPSTGGGALAAGGSLLGTLLGGSAFGPLGASIGGGLGGAAGGAVG